MLSAIKLAVSIIGGWRALAMAVAALSLAGYVLWLRADAADARADNAQLRTNVAQLEEVNRRTAESFARAQLEHARAEAALVRQAARGAVNASELSTLTTEARNAPDDRPVGPVLERGFDRLRTMDGAAGGGGNPDGQGDAP